MKTLLLFIPSALAVAGLVWHAWRYRGRRIALTYFPAAFVFGIVRGNMIHWISVDMQGGVMPYVFSNPVIQIFSASLQAVIGWVFSLYVSWWLAERVLERIPALRGDLMATVGLSCVGMAALSYATEAGAAAAGWWVWSIPTYNRFFLNVPALGIAEWFAVGFEFLIPYLLVFCSPHRGRIWPHALWGIFLLHLVLHLFGDPISGTMPMQPFVVWHWLSLLCMAGLALTGIGSVRIQTVDSEGDRRSVAWVMWGVVGLFAAVMAGAQAGIGDRPELLVSLVWLAMLVLLALRRISLWWLVILGLGTWVWEGFRFTFLPGPVVVFLLLEGRVRWGGRILVRVAVFGSLAALAVGRYWDGLALRRQSDAYVTHLQRAEVHIRQGRKDLAIRERTAARMADPVDVEAYLRMGYALEARGHVQLAMAQYRRAIALEPGLFLGHYDLGIALEAQKDVKGAEVAYRRALSIAPRFYQGHLRLGALYMEKSRVKEAMVHFQRATEIAPDRPMAYNNLGVAYQGQGQKDLAMEAWQKALSLDPNYADVHVNIGDAHILGGRTQEGIHAYETAIRIDPNHARAQQGLGIATLKEQLESEGKKPEAEGKEPKP